MMFIHEIHVLTSHIHFSFCMIPGNQSEVDQLKRDFLPRVFLRNFLSLSTLVMIGKVIISNI